MAKILFAAVQSPNFGANGNGIIPTATPTQQAPLTDWLGLAVRLDSYWRTVRKRWPLVLSVAAALFGAVALWTYRQPKIYRATCSIVIEPSAPQVLEGVKEVVALGAGGYQASQEFYQTQFRIITSKEIAQRVIDKLDLVADPNYPSPGAGKNRPANASLVGSVLNQLHVLPVKDSRVANIIVEDRNPERAALIANAVAEAYIQSNLELKLEGTRAASTWLGGEIGDLSKTLRDSEIKLYQYREKRQLLDLSLDTKQNLNTQNVQTYNARLAEVRTKRLELESHRKLILEAKDNIDEEESLPEVRENTIIQGLRTSFFELSKVKADLETRYGARHPKIDAIKEQLSSLRRDYVAEIEKLLKSHDKAYQAAVEYERSLTKLIDQEKHEAIDLARLSVEYKPLAREVDNNEKMWMLIQQRQKEAGITGLDRTNNVRVLDAAAPVYTPVRPQVWVNLTIAGLAGLLLGLASSLLIEATDTTLRSQDHVETVIGAPVLGMIPILGDAHEKNGNAEDQRLLDLDVFRAPNSTAAEACRSIRTNLIFLSPDHPLKSLVITSPGPREGKTTTAISLAISMAQSGARVLLVDTDLRRPRIHRAFSVRNETGVSSVVVGEATLDKAVVSTAVPNLFVLPSGPIPPNPAELLHTKRFSELMADCAARYDRVIYDSPPVSAVTDPALIGNLSDGVLLIVRAGHTTRDAAAFARRQLTDAKALIRGAIVNRVNLSDRGYYYYYYARYYGGQYGSGYYGRPEEAAKA